MGQRWAALARAGGLLVMLGAASASTAQAPADLGDPALRAADAPPADPNISGVWQVRGYDRAIVPIEGPIPFQPWNKAEFDRRAAAEASGHPLFDPTAACMPSGVPRILAAPYPVQIVQTRDEIVMLYEVQHLFRVIRMNAAHRPAAKPSFMGDAVGRWEGDTLVIDTVALTPRTQIDEAGVQHSDALHVVERLRRVGSTLVDRFTIDDPKAFTQPWTAERVFYWRPGGRLTEYVCEENNRNAPNAQGVLREF